MALVVQTFRRALGSGEGSVSRENVMAKAQRYLAEGRIRILACNEDDGTILADVRGTGASYTVERDGERWRCYCSARGECCHILALKFVTVFAPKEPRL
jgi:hypothetical protein